MSEERKLVTILFADVTGSTALGESLDPEDVRALMVRYYEHAKEFLEESPFQEDMRTYAGKVARALKEENYTELAEAIEETEAHQLIVYAARMRIVLARHTKDRSQLDRARPVLERVGDRQFLRRLEEVEASLSAPLEQRQE